MVAVKYLLQLAKLRQARCQNIEDAADFVLAAGEIGVRVADISAIRALVLDSSGTSNINQRILQDSILTRAEAFGTIGYMAATKVTVINNGPIRIEGDFTVNDPDGKEYGLAGRTVISLCRCGFSSNKPFCDGQHGVKGFESACQARDLPPPKPKI